MNARPEPADGTAIVLHLIEAARAIADQPYTEAPTSTPEANLRYWVTVLEQRYEREQSAPEPVGWHPRTWGEVVEGDHVQLQGVVALVKAATTLHWHVDPSEDKDNQYHPRVMEHVDVRVTLHIEGHEKPVTYPFPPGGEIEVLRGPAGQAVDEANGYRADAGEEPIDVLHSWAEDAAITLNTAGLGPIEVIK